MHVNRAACSTKQRSTELVPTRSHVKSNWSTCCRNHCVLTIFNSWRGSMAVGSATIRRFCWFRHTRFDKYRVPYRYGPKESLVGTGGCGSQQTVSALGFLCSQSYPSVCGVACVGIILSTLLSIYSLACCAWCWLARHTDDHRPPVWCINRVVVGVFLFV